MKALLDTHVFLWAISEPERLSPRARRVIEDPLITADPVMARYAVDIVW